MCRSSLGCSESLCHCPATCKYADSQHTRRGLSRCHDRIGGHDRSATTPRDWTVWLSVKQSATLREVTTAPPTHNAAAACHGAAAASICVLRRPVDWCSWFSRRRNVNVYASWSQTAITCRRRIPTSFWSPRRTCRTTAASILDNTEV